MKDYCRFSLNMCKKTLDKTKSGYEAKLLQCSDMYNRCEDENAEKKKLAFRLENKTDKLERCQKEAQKYKNRYMNRPSRWNWFRRGFMIASIIWLISFIFMEDKYVRQIRSYRRALTKLGNQAAHGATRGAQMASEGAQAVRERRGSGSPSPSPSQQYRSPEHP